MRAHTTAPASADDANGRVRVSERRKRLEQRQPSRAVHRSSNSGTSGVLGVEADRFDHEVEFVGPVNPGRHPVGQAGPYELVFGKDRGPVNALRVAVLRQRNRIRRIFRPREQEHFGAARLYRQVRMRANENLETRVKNLPRPRPWGLESPTTLPEKLRSFYTGTDNRASS